MKASFIIGMTLGTVATVAALNSDAGRNIKRAVTRKMNRIF